MTDYTQMGHEELAHAADPLNRVVNRDVPILGYMPTDEEVAAARGELDQLNAAARSLNAVEPWHVGAIGPEARGLNEADVVRLVEAHLREQAAE